MGQVQLFTVCSVYLSPNYCAQEYGEILEALEDCLMSIPGHFVVGGDFNARVVEWSMPSKNVRGRLIMEMASMLDLEVTNRGAVPT